MKLTFDRRYDRWEFYKETEERCNVCMKDAPYEYCCKNQCGKFTFCESCNAECRTSKKLCEK